MIYVVRELTQAKQDKADIAGWLHERSPTGAAAWLDAYDATIERLQNEADSFADAPESKDCKTQIRQALFKTRRGRVYRTLFFIEGHEVFIARVRGPGQAPIDVHDLA
jgi:plasmid stabilization system protein ParE